MGLERLWVEPVFLYYPELADDTYGTIGLTEPEHTSDIPDAMDPKQEDPSQPISILPDQRRRGLRPPVHRFCVVRVEHGR